MADTNNVAAEEIKAEEESLMEKITENFVDSSDDEKIDPAPEKVHSPAKVTEKKVEDNKVYRMFGREKPVHHLLGGGKPADVFLWRDKKISGGVLGFATLIWVLFELLEYHLLTLICHILILAFSVLFLGSNVCTFINRSPPQFPEVVLPENLVLGIASTLRVEINRAFAILRDIASGKELKKFLAVIAGLWVASIVGAWCNFLTLFYISFVLLHTVPVFYEKFEDQVDPVAEKALAEFKKQYAVFDAKVLSQIPRGPLKAKKQA